MTHSETSTRAAASARASPGLLAASGAILRREIAMAWDGGGGAATPLGFLLGAAAFTPLAVGSDVELLARIGPPLLVVFCALAALMTFERLFQPDLEDSSLDQWALSPWPMELFAALKGWAALAAIGLPLVLAAAPLAIALQAPPERLPAILAAIALALAAFFGIGVFGASLAAGVRRGGLLIAVIVVPFFAPPLIFASGAVLEAIRGGPLQGALTLLAACALFAQALGPIGAALVLRSHLD